MTLLGTSLNPNPNPIPHLTLTIQWSVYFYCYHFIHEETEAQQLSKLPKVAQLISNGFGIWIQIVWLLSLTRCDFDSPFCVLYLGYRVKFLKLIILWGDIYSAQSSGTNPWETTINFVCRNFRRVPKDGWCQIIYIVLDVGEEWWLG